MTQAVRLRLSTILIFASVALPIATIGLPLSIYLAPFYAGEIGLPLGALGAAMVLARFVDIVSDPLIGTLTDRWRPRVGRRRVWLLIGVPVLVTGMMQLFNPPEQVGFLYFIGWLTVMYLGFTMVRLPHLAWGGELSPDYHERTRIAAFRQTFSILGLVLSTVVPAIVLSRAGATSADVLSSLSLMMLVLLPFCAALVFFFVPEPPPVANEPRVTLKQGWRALKRNGPLKRMLLVLFIGFIAETFRVTITVFFARDVIGVPNLGAIYVYYFVSAFAFVPFWRWLAKRIGKHRALCAAFVIVIATNCSIFLLGRGDVLAFTIMFVAKGACFGALELLPQAMIADTGDVDAAISRERRQGLMFAIFGIVVNAGQAIGQGLSLNLLGLIGYNAAGESGADQLFWLRLFYTVLPSLLLAVSLWLAWRYPLTAARHDRLRERLRRRDDAGSAMVAASVPALSRSPT